MTRDRVELGLLVISFAGLLTTHVALAMGLLRRTPWWRGLVAFFVPPLAPLWGWQGHMRVRGVLWIAAALAYGVTLVIASASG